jgi:hypothetical protein
MTNTPEHEQQLRDALQRFIADGGCYDQAFAMLCAAYGLKAIPPAGSVERGRLLGKVEVQATASKVGNKGKDRSRAERSKDSHTQCQRVQGRRSDEAPPDDAWLHER